MMASTRRLVGTLGIASAALAVAAALPAQSASKAYVALGDSYSSGTGTRSYLSDGTSCQRSVYAYPSLLSASKGLDLNFRACSGASVADVAGTQLGALGAATGLVTVSVGGNDAGFAAVLTECAKPAWMSDCHGAIDKAQQIINTVLPGRLSTLYGSIRSRAPRARAVAVGYPRLFMGVDCNAGTWFSSTEMARLNQTADLLNDRTGQQAAAHGLAFSNPTSAFTGHAVCSSSEWINGLSYPLSESYHPNRPGHQGYAGVVAPSLVGSSYTSSATVLTAARASAGALAAQQRRYAAVDAAITPETFQAPDLSTPEARVAAARAGIDLSSRASIDAADRRYSAAQSAAR
jgi:lysophospholipase L1-like esterase